MNVTNISQNICDHCAVVNDIHCEAPLHSYYFASGIATVIASSIVIISYIFSPRLRYFPAVLIFNRSVFDLMFGVHFMLLRYVNLQHLRCKPNVCDLLGISSYFLFLCSIGCYISLSVHLYESVKNPFASPKTQNLIMTNVIIIFCAAIICALAQIIYNQLFDEHMFYYREDLQFCFFHEYSKENYSINFHNIIFLYSPSILACFIGLVITIMSSARLIRGLPHTFEFRKSAIYNSWMYALFFIFHIVMVGTFYFMTWASLHVYEILALTVPSFGVFNCFCWIITHYRKRKSKQRKRMKSTFEDVAKINQLKLKHPKDIFKNIQHDVSDSCIKTFCDGIGISVVNDEENINEALRRDVLAYCTDGISQSVDRCYKKKSKPNDSHYPASIKDFRAGAIVQFPLTIQKNRALNKDIDADIIDYYSARQTRTCCCIKSTAQNDMMIPLTSFNVIEEHSDVLHQEEREFVDFAPMIFRYIRNDIIGISDEEYQKSIIPLDVKQQLKVLQNCKISDGKSGAFFFITHDSKFVVKTLKQNEIKFLISILKSYVKYLQANKYTILSRYVGLHSLKIYGLTKYFVVMENVFKGNYKPTEMYDLKGSWIHRVTDYRVGSGSVMLDCDLKKPIIMDENNRTKILNQLEKDTTWLQQHNIIDYSLLLGIYYFKIEFQPTETKDENVYSSESLSGIRAKINDSAGVYFIGIIDGLQPYNFKKQMENLYKSCKYRSNNKGISVVNPVLYQKRFVNYMNDVIVSQTQCKSKLQNIFHSTEKVLIYTSALQYTKKQQQIDSKDLLVISNRFAYSQSVSTQNAESDDEKDDVMDVTHIKTESDKIANN
eukprot:539568_1